MLEVETFMIFPAILAAVLWKSKESKCEHFFVLARGDQGFDICSVKVSNQQVVEDIRKELFVRSTKPTVPPYLLLLPSLSMVGTAK